LPKPVRLRVSGIEADVSGMAWPLRGPLAVRLGVVPPGGGRLEVRGRVAADPLGADLRVVASNTEVAAYRPYLPIAADVSGRADAALAVTVPPTGVEGTTVRGQAGLSGLDVRDGKRTVLRVERALAEGVDVAWPRRIAAAVLHLERPWLLVERDERGALPLRKLFTAVPNSTSSQGTRASRSGPPSMPAGEAAQDRLAGRPEEGPPLAGGGGPLALAVERVRVAAGGVRVVDRGASGAFAVDLRDLLLRADGFSTAPAPPARIELTGRFARGAELVARGSIGALGAPLHVDATAELKSFEIPLVNPYLSQQVAWRAERGSLTTSVRARVRGDALDARTEVLLSHLLVVRSGPEDMARGRFGLPLGLIISLMKDQQGDIRLVFPIGGRLQDPRFDVSEAIWSAIRTVAIKLITLPISSIGRVRVGRDSRIESIELEPIRFEPAVDRLTPEGRAQLARVADFLRQTPDVRMALTPVSARSDLLELRRRRATEAIERVERRSRLPREVAAARLFAERFPERALPRTPDALVSALAVSEPEPTAELEVLATARMRAVRAALDRARIDGDRLLAGRAREEPPDAGPAAVPGVELQMVEPDTAPRPGILERIRRLGPTTGRE
jgi:hypothetical protein